MTEHRYTVQHKRRAHDGFIALDLYDAVITRGDQRVEVVREVHDHGDGAAVLPYDPDRGTALLVRQLRVPVHVASGEGLILEAAAGLIDPTDKDPAEAAAREGAEELRYRIRNLRHVGTFYTIPGLVTERMSCFLGEYAPQDRITEGFDPDEDEVLDVEEWGLADLWDAWVAGRLTDVKAIVCLQALRLDRPELFGR